MSEQPHRPRRGLNIPLLVIAAAALVAFLILKGLGDHLLSLAPLPLFLACPLTIGTTGRFERKLQTSLARR